MFLLLTLLWTAADYAIAQFKYLEQLLLVHGRYSYKRITMLIKYCFYKNYVFGLTQLWFGLFNKFSGQTMFDTWMLAFYNLLFTSLPIMFFAVLDKDVRLRTAKALPQLYATGLNDQEFNLPIFLSWLFRGFAESCVIFFVSYLVFIEDNVIADGTNAGIWAMGMTAASAVVVVVTAKLALYVNNWTVWQAGIMGVSVFVFYIFLLLVALLSPVPKKPQVCFVFSSADSSFCRCLTVRSPDWRCRC